MDAQTVKQRLLSNLEPYLFWLLPAGKVHGNEFRVGNVQGAPGKSLAVVLRGEAIGVWQDYAEENMKGDIYELHMKAKGCDFPTMFREVCQYLGINQIERPKPKAKPPSPDLSEVGLMQRTPVYDYILNQRGISEATMRKYRLKSLYRKTPINEWHVCFQYFDPAGELVMIKTLGLNRWEETGKKEIWSSTPYYTCFGWHTVKPSDRSIIICTGEIDALTVDQLAPGMPVVSVPAGDQNMGWIEIDYDAFLRFETIYLCFDSDPSGDSAAQEVAKRLGLARCQRLPVPIYKDANQCLMESVRTGEPHLLEISSWFAKAYSYDPPTLRSAGSYLDAAKRRLNRWQEEDKAPTFVFPEVPFNVRSGECTLLTGISSHGKSEMMYQILGHEMKNGHKVCICSMEIDPDEMMLNMTQQLLGHAPKAHELEIAFSSFDGKLWFFAPKEDTIKTNWRPLFEDFGYAAKRYGCTRFAIDSLLFITKKDDYEAQDEFCKAVRDFDRFNDTHSFLIAHASPKKDENAVPRLSDINGSSGIIAPFNNILIVWRNVEKEDKKAKAIEDEDTPEVEKLNKTHDAILFVAKQRHTGRRSKTKLWFDLESRCFRGKVDLPPPIIGTQPFPF